jgi:hypothetical protein
MSAALDGEHPSVWARKAAFVVELLMGVGAFYGGASLLRDAEGFGVKRAWLEGSPFSDYTVPALLLLALGCGMIGTALLAARDSRMGGTATRIMGALLIVFISIETAVIGYHGGSQTVLLAVCGASGLALMLLSTRME